MVFVDLPLGVGASQAVVACLLGAVRLTPSFLTTRPILAPRQLPGCFLLVCLCGHAPAATFSQRQVAGQLFQSSGLAMLSGVGRGKRGSHAFHPHGPTGQVQRSFPPHGVRLPQSWESGGRARRRPRTPRGIRPFGVRWDGGYRPSGGSSSPGGWARWRLRTLGSLCHLPTFLERRACGSPLIHDPHTSP